MEHKGISLRYQILLLVAGIPLAALVLFFIMVTGLFEQDKTSYIFDSSQTNTRSKASSFSSEIRSSLNTLNNLNNSIDLKTKYLSNSGHQTFSSSPDIQAFYSFKVDPQLSLLSQTKLAHKAQKKFKKIFQKENRNLLDPNYVIQQMGSQDPYVTEVKHSQQHLFIASVTKEDNYSKEVTCGIFRKQDLSLLFQPDEERPVFLINTASNTALMGNKDIDLISSVVQQSKKSSLPEITKEVSQGGHTYILSIVRTPFDNLVIASAISLLEVEKATDYLSMKSLIFFIAIFSLTIIIAILATKTATSSLENLSEATKNIARGDFNITVDQSVGGEIGQLARNFQTMATEVSHLMEETHDKARMEAELKTAQAVQELLLPPEKIDDGPVHVFGAAIAAEECGGDWWHYFHTEQHFFLIISDATGHGAPAALLTSAARSAVSIVESLGVSEPSKIFEYLSEAIYQTSKGKMVMTAFILRIDKATGEMVYSNASHDPPYLIKNTLQKPYKWRDLSPLMECIGPRLGENSHQTYSESTLELKSGDKFLLYTDGVFEVRNVEDKLLKERIFIKKCAELFSKPSNKTIVPSLVEFLDDYRKNTSLDDDITLVTLRYDQTG